MAVILTVRLFFRMHFNISTTAPIEIQGHSQQFVQLQKSSASSLNCSLEPYSAQMLADSTQVESGGAIGWTRRSSDPTLLKETSSSSMQHPPSTLLLWIL